jgi:hypothetical protein
MAAMSDASGSVGGSAGTSGVSKTTIRIVDQSGRQVRRIVKDQQVHVEVLQPGKVDPASPPKPIEVTFSKEGGWFNDDLTVAYGGDHRLPDTKFRSEPLTIASGGEGGGRTSIGGFTWKTGDFGGMSTRDGHQVSVQGPDGSSATVQVFTSWASLAHQELTDAATLQRNTGRAGAANLEQALTKLAEVRTWPDIDPVKADKLEAQIRARLADIKRLVCLAEHALAYLENDKLLLQKQNAAARYYLGGARGQGADPGEINHQGVNDWMEKASEDTWDNIVVGSMAKLALDSYKGITNATGVAQLKTLLTGVDEMGKKVSWDKRAVAFLDLVANAAMTGAGTLKTMRDLSSKTRMGGPGKAGKLDDGSTPQRYKGDDLEQAPSGTIVDPGQLGYSPDGVAAAHQIARKHDVVIQSRPTNPMARWWKEEHGAIPKPEKFKAKTVSPVDQTLGADPSMPPGRVALFDPKPDVFTDKLRAAGVSDAQIGSTLDQLHAAGASGGKVKPDIPDNPAGSGMTDKQWSDTVKRYSQRHGEYHGSTGQAMRKMEAAGEIEIGPGGIVTVDGKFVAGDYDTWDILKRDGSPVSMEKHLEVIGDLKGNAFEAQHPAHMRWDPQREQFPDGAYGDAKFKDARGIYEKIIGGHKDNIVGGKQQGEILLNFSPEGPPIALYSGQQPAGRWFGDMPLNYGELTPGAGWRVPTQWAWFGTGVATQQLRMDDDAQAWSQSLSDFIKELEPCHTCVETPMVLMPEPRKSWIPKAAAGAGAVLILGAGTFGLTRGGDDPEPAAALPDPVIIEDIGDDVGDDVSDGPIDIDPDPGPVEDDPGSDVVVPEPAIIDEEPPPEILLPPATSFELIDNCITIYHAPNADYPGSPSWFDVITLVAATNGTYPEGATATLDMNADALGRAPLGPNGTLAFQMPISSFGPYESTTFEIDGIGPIGGGPLFVDVGPDEGPVDGCVPVNEFDPDAAIALLEEAGWAAEGGPLDDGSGDTSTDPGGDPGTGPAVVDEPDDAIPPPEDELALVREFLGRLDRAHIDGDADTLFSLLDPLVISRYGADQCMSYLQGVAGSITELQLLDGRRQPYEYPTDGLTVPPFEAWNVDMEATVLGQDRQTFNLNISEGGPDGSLAWFSDCGDPI